jgi:hypothetical protein
MAYLRFDNKMMRHQEIQRRSPRVLKADQATINKGVKDAEREMTIYQAIRVVQNCMLCVREGEKGFGCSKEFKQQTPCETDSDVQGFHARPVFP